MAIIRVIVRLSAGEPSNSSNSIEADIETFGVASDVQDIANQAVRQVVAAARSEGDTGRGEEAGETPHGAG